jgi:hypothetical protein
MTDRHQPGAKDHGAALTEHVICATACLKHSLEEGGKRRYRFGKARVWAPRLWGQALGMSGQLVPGLTTEDFVRETIAAHVRQELKAR